MTTLTAARTTNADVRPDRRGRRWRRWLAALLALACLLALAWVVAFSRVLAADSVKVEGTVRLTPAQVVAAAEVPLGVPLVRIDRGAITRRVEALAEVRSARVELSFPNMVVVEVTERVAAAYGLSPTGHYTYVDASGRTFGDFVTAPSALPRLAPATASAGDQATLAAMAHISAALPSTIRAQVRQVTATAADDIILVLRDGRLVVWGDATRNADKARVLPALLKRKGHVLDVSNPDLVFTH